MTRKMSCTESTGRSEKSRSRTVEDEAALMGLRTQHDGRSPGLRHDGRGCPGRARGGRCRGNGRGSLVGRGNGRGSLVGRGNGRGSLVGRGNGTRSGGSGSGVRSRGSDRGRCPGGSDRGRSVRRRELEGKRELHGCANGLPVLLRGLERPSLDRRERRFVEAAARRPGHPRVDDRSVLVEGELDAHARLDPIAECVRGVNPRRDGPSGSAV